MKVLITGMGLVTPCDFAPLVAADAAKLPPRSDWPEITLIDVPAGAPEIAHECADFNLTQEVPTKYPFIDRCSALALGATARALKDAGLTTERTRTESIGLCFASAWGCLDAMRTFYEKIKEGKPQHSSPLPFSHSFANSPSSLLAIEFGLHGFATTWAGGAMAGLGALESAVGALESGLADRMLVVVSDAISHGTFHHYWAKGQLAKDGAAAAQFEGFVLAEGAAAFVLETAAAFAARGGKTPAGGKVPEFTGQFRFDSYEQLDPWFAAQNVGTLWSEPVVGPGRDKGEAFLRQATRVVDTRVPQNSTGNAMSVSPLWALALAAKNAAAEGRTNLVVVSDFPHVVALGATAE